MEPAIVPVAMQLQGGAQATPGTLQNNTFGVSRWRE